MKTKLYNICKFEGTTLILIFEIYSCFVYTHHFHYTHFIDFMSSIFWRKLYPLDFSSWAVGMVLWDSRIFYVFIKFTFLFCSLIMRQSLSTSLRISSVSRSGNFSLALTLILFFHSDSAKTSVLGSDTQLNRLLHCDAKSAIFIKKLVQTIPAPSEVGSLSDPPNWWLRWWQVCDWSPLLSFPCVGYGGVNYYYWRFQGF